jgi:hypothetical protein
VLSPPLATTTIKAMAATTTSRAAGITIPVRCHHGNGCVPASGPGGWNPEASSTGRYCVAAQAFSTCSGVPDSVAAHARFTCSGGPVCVGAHGALAGLGVGTSVGDDGATPLAVCCGSAGGLELSAVTAVLAARANSVVVP